MKKIIGIILLLSSFVFAQYDSPKIVELENSIKNINQNSALENTQLHSNLSLGKKKNTGIAVILSLVLPGMGELYSGSYSSGKYFTIAEVAFWGTYIGLNSYSNWMQGRYKSFAASSAGVNNNGKDGNFYANVGNYQSEDEYNNDQALQGNFSQMYNSSSFYWKWQTIADRKNYRDMWTSSEQAKNNLRFVVGALILNRIVSAINAARLVAAFNKNIETSWDVSVGLSNYSNLPSQLFFNFQTRL